MLSVHHKTVHLIAVVGIKIECFILTSLHSYRSAGLNVAVAAGIGVDDILVLTRLGRIGILTFLIVRDIIVVGIYSPYSVDRNIAGPKDYFSYGLRFAFCWSRFGVGIACAPPYKDHAIAIRPQIRIATRF